MHAFEFGELAARQQEGSLAYLEFLRTADMSLGLYVLEAGSSDPQQPHTEEEVYIVMEGQALIRVAGEDRPVSHGSVVHVPAGLEHRFHSIEQRLRVLVLFAPPEHSTA